MADINEVIIEGKIVHKFVTPKIAILTIGTGEKGKERNHPKILFFGDFISDIKSNYNVGDNVLVHGNIQSSKKRPDIENQNTVSIFGESIEKSKTDMEATFDIKNDNDHHFNYQNEIKIAGKLVRIDKQYDNLVRFKILTTKNDRISFINLVYYNNHADEIMKKFKKDDRVCVLGCVQTIKKEINCKTHHFENYVVKDIALL